MKIYLNFQKNGRKTDRKRTKNGRKWDKKKLMRNEGGGGEDSK